jgi:hypothetical protein
LIQPSLLPKAELTTVEDPAATIQSANHTGFYSSGVEISPKSLMKNSGAVFKAEAPNSAVS